jgi:hypothetical protein
MPVTQDLQVKCFARGRGRTSRPSSAERVSAAPHLPQAAVSGPALVSGCPVADEMAVREVGEARPTPVRKRRATERVALQRGERAEAGVPAHGSNMSWRPRLAAPEDVHVDADVTRAFGRL